MEHIKRINELSNLDSLKEYLDTLSPSVLIQIADVAKDAYYNTDTPLFSDAKYDVLADVLAKTGYKKIGAQIREGEGRPPKISLPFWMGSANKITPEEQKEWERWKGKYSETKFFICSDKLDGVSCLVEYTGGGDTSPRLYSRGDGDEGSDLSSLVAHIQHLPKLKKSMFVRGELIISKKDFAEKHSKTYKNARNMVAGLLGSKTLRKGTDDIQFIAYELISKAVEENVDSPHSQLPPKEAFSILEKNGFRTVYHTEREALSLSKLAELFIQRKEESEFEIDGIIVQPNQEYTRNTEGNPDYLLAFKMLIDENVLETTVKRVEWNVSKHLQLKPVVIIEPVDIDGTTISRATGHNAKYIFDNSIGKGAVIKITRSKQVIPFIVSVVKSTSPDMPPEGEWKWDKTRVNILSLAEDTSDSCIKLLATFFQKMGILFVSEETVRALYESEFDTLIKIVSASYEDILSVPKFQEKSAKRIYNNIREGMKKADIPTILGSCAIFGFAVGRKRVKELFDNFPTILEDYKEMTKYELHDRIMNIRGFGEEITDKIVQNIKYADRLIIALSPYMSKEALSYQKEEVEGGLEGEKVVFSGFRDAVLQEKIERKGGKVMSSVSGNTTILVVKNDSELTSSKAVKAQSLNIKIITKDKFIEKYNIT